MIVNDHRAVDKADFVYRLNGLRHVGRVGKALYAACTDVGQKTKHRRQPRFCTSDPVDMQRFFHNRPSAAQYCGHHVTVSESFSLSATRRCHIGILSACKVRMRFRCHGSRVVFLQTNHQSISYGLNDGRQPAYRFARSSKMTGMRARRWAATAARSLF